MNTLADFPPDQFQVHAYCRCGHSGEVNTGALPTDLPMPRLHQLLRTRRADRGKSACGSGGTGAASFDMGRAIGDKTR